MDLAECFRKGMIRKVTVDRGLIASLTEMADIKQKTVLFAKVDHENISAYVSMAYDSLREILESICISLGYKVISHVCIGALLQKNVKDFDYDSFDRFRFVKNSINYYGIKIEYEQGKQIIKKIFNMKEELKKLT